MRSPEIYAEIKSRSRNHRAFLFWRRPIHSFGRPLARYLCGLDRLSRGSQPLGSLLEKATPKQNAQHISRHAGRSVLATSYSRTAYRRTTIGAAVFHFRVRNGNGWDRCAIVTRVRSRTGGLLLSQRRKREAESLGTFRRSWTAATVFQRTLTTLKHQLILWHLHTGSMFVARFNALTLQRITQL